MQFTKIMAAFLLAATASALPTADAALVDTPALDLAAISKQYEQFPQCARDCFLLEAPHTACDLTDKQCTCYDKIFHKRLEKCVKKRCKFPQQIKTVKEAKKICKGQ